MVCKIKNGYLPLHSVSAVLSRGVTGNTPDFGSGESRFEP